MAQDPKSESATMFSLLRLPRELILHMIEHSLHHEDLENFAMSSKAMFELSRIARARHLEAKSRYHTFSGGEHDPSHGDAGHPVRAMCRLLQANEFNQYCKVLQLHRVGTNGLLSRWKAKTVKKMEKHFSTLEPKIRALGDHLPDDFRRDYSEHVTKSQQGLSHLLYWLPLAILPSIQVLELNHCTEIFKSLRPIMRMFAQSKHELGRNPGVLPPLREFRVTHGEVWQGPGLDVLCMFAMLPTLRKLYSFLSHIRKRSEPEQPISEARSNVEEIQISGGFIDAEGLAQLLSSITALRAFSCNEIYNRGVIENPRACLSVLMEKAAITLETLNFIPGPDILRNQHEDAALSISLKDFKYLKYAAITCSLFIQLKNIPSETPVVSTIKPSVMPFAEDRQVKNVLKLADVLPPSIEILHLFHPEPRVPDLEHNYKLGNVLEDMFVGFSRTREEYLPKLRCIIVQGKDRLSQRTKEECKRLGIILAFPTP